MARKPHWISDIELLRIARDVLTGRIDREQLARQRGFDPVTHRHVLAYVGVTLMVATRYRLNDRNVVLGPLRDALYDLMYKDTWAECEHAAGLDEYTVPRAQFQIAAAQLELYRQGKRSQPLVLSPPTAIRELVKHHGNNPAVRAFLDDAGIEDESSLAAIRRNAKGVAREFGRKYGRGSLEVLLAEVRAALEEK